MKPLSTSIPFAGFYESAHSDQIDQAESQLISGVSGEPLPDLDELIWRNANYPAIHKGYAKLYTENFALNFKIPLRFETLQSPKQYNFETDRIFAHISLSTVRRLFRCTNQADLARHIKDKFTSYDGFISFYSNDLQHPDWQVPLTDWDANMVGTLIEAYLEQEFGDSLRETLDWELVDDSNGAISNLVWENLPQEIQAQISEELAKEE